MLILPPGHWEAMAGPRQPRPRERWIIGSVIGLLVAGGVALVISLVSTGQTSRSGCVHVTAAFVTGGTELYRCGPDARALCASAGSGSSIGGASSAALARSLVSECRKAGLPVSR